METSRRDLFATAALALAGTALRARAADAGASPPDAGTVPGLSEKTLAEAEKVFGIQLTAAERAQAARSIGGQIRDAAQRRKTPLPIELEPASTFHPLLPGRPLPKLTNKVVRSSPSAKLPGSDEDIAFAPVTQLSRWLEKRQLTSERLTGIYLERLKRLDAKLHSVVTLCEPLALEQARRADKEIASGRYRGPLHGVPYGAKDLLDTKAIATTFGAEPFRNRVPDRDAVSIRRLADAGAVLVAKLSLGALAMNDVWFGGQTRNPWMLDEGSSGSSAGPGSATAAALVGFAIGSETWGSIVSPSMRCGITGLRPTFGRVARTGAMPLCWTMDKLGPMCRTVEDCALVLAALNGGDTGDASSVTVPYEFQATPRVRGVKVGYFKTEFEGAPKHDAQVLDLLRRLGATLVELPGLEMPVEAAVANLLAEAAASFERLTLENLDDQLAMQTDDAWPNTFRLARFLSAVDAVQADRVRRWVMRQMADHFDQVEAIVAPSYARSLLVTNLTGHPSLTLRVGSVEVTEMRSDFALPAPKKLPAPRQVPHGITFYGRLFEDGALCRLGLAVESELGVWRQRPSL